MRPLLRRYLDYFATVGPLTGIVSETSNCSCVCVDFSSHTKLPSPCVGILTHGKNTSKTMTKQKVEIEIDIPDGYEFVRLGRQFNYEAGERAFNLPQDENRLEEPTYAICRPTWQWPKWLTAAWIAMDADGVWFAYDSKPTKSITCWLARSRGCLTMRLDHNSLINFTTPVCADWTQSAQKNPRHIKAS